MKIQNFYRVEKIIQVQHIFESKKTVCIFLNCLESHTLTALFATCIYSQPTSKTFNTMSNHIDTLGTDDDEAMLLALDQAEASRNAVTTTTNNTTSSSSLSLSVASADKPLLDKLPFRPMMLYNASHSLLAHDAGDALIEETVRMWNQIMRGRITRVTIVSLWRLFKLEQLRDQSTVITPGLVMTQDGNDVNAPNGNTASSVQVSQKQFTKFFQEFFLCFCSMRIALKELVEFRGLYERRYSEAYKSAINMLQTSYKFELIPYTYVHNAKKPYLASALAGIVRCDNTSLGIYAKVNPSKPCFLPVIINFQMFDRESIPSATDDTPTLIEDVNFPLEMRSENRINEKDTLADAIKQGRGPHYLMYVTETPKCWYFMVRQFNTPNETVVLHNLCIITRRNDIQGVLDQITERYFEPIFKPMWARPIEPSKEERDRIATHPETASVRMNPDTIKACSKERSFLLRALEAANKNVQPERYTSEDLKKLVEDVDIPTHLVPWEDPTFALTDITTLYTDTGANNAKRVGITPYNGFKKPAFDLDAKPTTAATNTSTMSASTTGSTSAATATTTTTTTTPTVNEVGITVKPKVSAASLIAEKRKDTSDADTASKRPRLNGATASTTTKIGSNPVVKSIAQPLPSNKPIATFPPDAPAPAAAAKTPGSTAPTKPAAKTTGGAPSTTTAASKPATRPSTTPGAAATKPNTPAVAAKPTGTPSTTTTTGKTTTPITTPSKAGTTPRTATATTAATASATPTASSAKPAAAASVAPTANKSAPPKTALTSTANAPSVVKANNPAAAAAAATTTPANKTVSSKPENKTAVAAPTTAAKTAATKTPAAPTTTAAATTNKTTTTTTNKPSAPAAPNKTTPTAPTAAASNKTAAAPAATATSTVASKTGIAPAIKTVVGTNKTSTTPSGTPTTVNKTNPVPAAGAKPGTATTTKTVPASNNKTQPTPSSKPATKPATGTTQQATATPANASKSIAKAPIKPSA
jgi:tRNA uridine 5-carbamoylmethylation protein Kti12